VAIVISLAAAGCTPPPDVHARRFSEILYRYPMSDEPLRIKQLTSSSARDIAPEKRERSVTVMVHPAYSLFFREEHRSAYTEAKFDLLKFQLDSEARFITETAKAGSVLIIVLPGDFMEESTAALSFITYLNSTAGSGASVYYLTSDSWSTGRLSMNNMVTLYGFLNDIKATKMLIGGGYIGRCQREFYNQVAAYVDKVTPYIVAEISSISPDDISSEESVQILDSIRKGNYSPVRKFIDKKTQGSAHIIQLPGARGIGRVPSL
jgi:hypothetical protein